VCERVYILRNTLVTSHGTGMHSGTSIECYVRMQITRRVAWFTRRCSQVCQKI